MSGHWYLFLHMQKHLGFRYPRVTADSWYKNDETYDYLKEQEQAAYNKPQTYKKWKQRSFKQNISKYRNMNYDEATDTYT